MTDLNFSEKRFSFKKTIKRLVSKRQRQKVCKLTRFFIGSKRYLLFLSIFLISWQLRSEDIKIGLALSGGGARGLAHIGVLKVLEELDIQIDYVAGTSIGAVIGGLYAVGYSATQIEEIVLNQFDWDLIRLDYVARPDYYIGEKRWGNQYNWTFQLNENFHPRLPQGFIVGNRFINIFFNHVYPYSHIEDFRLLPIPYSAVATDLLTGEMVVLDSGNIHEAMRASMSVPSIFAPYELGEYLLIDGGIKMNLPSNIVRDMGADFIIGVQVTSELREKERLTNPITVLDQTINISSSERTLESLTYCSLIIEPALEELRATDFDKIQEIIAAGEEAARELLPELLELVRKQQKVLLNKPLPLTESITYNRILVEGNQYVSGSKIREYSGLTTNVPLSKEEILAGTQAVYNSNLFNQTYPVIRQTPAGYDLIIKVAEKPRNQLGINVRYNNSDDIILSGVVEMRNYIGNNSNLMIGMSIGGQRELLFDYVKNFGREWGVYFRIFPYINEHTLYLFNDNQEKISSSNALEYGSVLGIGAYALNRFIIESYLFSFNKMLYRNISEYDIDDQFFSSGIGLKFYHETLDDLVFPMTGRQTLLKYSYADQNVLSDFSYKKFYGRFQNLYPVTKNTSLKIQFEYGSFFDDETIDFDPFYVGGFDSFLGMYQYEQSAPVIKVLTLVGRIEMTRNIFVDLQLNLGNTGNYDLWKIDPSTLFGGGVKLGYMTMIGPLRGGFGFNRQGKFLTYISLGYDYDIFEFSRR